MYFFWDVLCIQASNITVILKVVEAKGWRGKLVGLISWLWELCSCSCHVTGGQDDRQQLASSDRYFLSWFFFQAIVIPSTRHLFLFIQWIKIALNLLKFFRYEENSAYRIRWLKKGAQSARIPVQLYLYDYMLNNYWLHYNALVVGTGCSLNIVFFP